MDKAKDDPLVMAYDLELGQLVPTPKSEAVSVPVCPVAIEADKGTPNTPRLARFFTRLGEALPDRLVSLVRVPDSPHGA